MKLKLMLMSSFCFLVVSCGGGDAVYDEYHDLVCKAASGLDGSMSMSEAMDLNKQVAEFAERYFIFFFKKGRIEVSKSWNFWFLLRMRLNMTKCRASTMVISRRLMVSSCVPLHKVHVKAQNLSPHSRG